MQGHIRHPLYNFDPIERPERKTKTNEVIVVVLFLICLNNHSLNSVCHINKRSVSLEEGTDSPEF